MIESVSSSTQPFFDAVRPPAAPPAPASAPAASAVEPWSATPPADALAMLDHAQGAIAALEADGHSLRFDVSTTADQTVSVKLLDRGGNVVSEIPARRALDLLTGEGSSAAVDTEG